MTDETARRKAEAERNEAESERVHNEEERKAHEGIGETEISRVDAESGRGETEIGRVDAESGRDDAEVLRESQSVSRREAEKSRVTAEMGRVIAEEKRSSVRLFYAKIAGVVALPLAFVALIPAIVGIVYLDRQSDQRAALVKENRGIIERQAKATQASREIIKRQAAALSYLCETTNVLSLVIGQLELVDKSFLGDPGLADTVKDKIRSRIRVYRVAQEEFAQREPCQVIE